MPIFPLPPLSGALVLAQQQDGAPPPGGPNMLVMLAGVMAIIVFVVILPERKARKRRQAMIDALAKNDHVLTTSGMYATVAAVGEQDVTIKFDEGPTRVRVQKSAIAAVLGDKGDAGKG